MEPPSLPRFEATQRREFLKRAAALGALVLVPGGLAACSKDDKDTFTSSSTSTTAAGSSASSTTAAADGATTTSGSSSGGALPASATLEVAFTYTADAGGMGPPHNPFIAVWVETAAGDLVANISVWYNPPKGDRWINNLSSWYSANGGTATADLEAKTGATRAAGSYTLSWDGNDASGSRAAQGDHVVFIESAREHGTHSLTSAPITLGDSGTDASLADNGELSAATATYKA